MLWRCTHKKARWCPVHGKCLCVVLNTHGVRIWDTPNHDDCPLHYENSLHAKKRLIRRRTQ